MNLKDFLSNKGKPPELYWSLVLEEGWVQAGIWYIDQSVAQVVGTSPVAAWETNEELVGATDTALSSAIQRLPDDYPEPNKTVFGVPSSWVKSGEINEEHLKLIKKVCSELSLVPVGFVVLPEAIAHLYKSEEGSPVNSIIMGVGKENIEIAVFSLGNLVGTTQVARSVSLIDDVTEGLSRFEASSPLPSRFILFDGKGGELEEAKDQLIKHRWEEGDKIKFLHTPKVEILSPERKVLATSLAGANEIGDVSKVATQDQKEEVEGPYTENIPQETANVQEMNEVTPEDLGFSLDTDVSLNKVSEPDIAKEFEKPPEVVHQPQVQVHRTAPVFEHKPKINLKEIFGKAKTKTLAFFKRLSFSAKVSSARSGPVKPALIVTVLLILVGLGAFWWFVPKAEVIVYVRPQVVQEEAEIVFTTNGQSDVESGAVAAQSITSNVSGEKTKSATGSKLVGDKAKGTVQIQNGTAFPINLTAGTFLVSSGNLKFELDQAASVSAALSPTSPGTASLSVTAGSIGNEYNLAKSEVFKVGNYPKAEVDATSITDFAGGSSRQISAVSKVDIETLQTSLKEELIQKAKDELTSKVTEGQVLISDFVSSDVASETFDHKQGEEANNVKLNMEIAANALAADKTKLYDFASKVLNDKKPNGFVLRNDQIKFEFTFVEQREENYVYKVKINANFLPSFSEKEIVDKIIGKNQEAAKHYLSSTPGFVRVGLKINPPYPFIFNTLPRVRKNIHVTVEAER